MCLMLVRYSLGMKATKNASRNLKPYGGLPFADKINADLLHMHVYCNQYGSTNKYPLNIELGGVLWTYIGDGADRVVYRHEGLILKFPSRNSYARKDANTLEFTVYERVLGTPVAHKFAPLYCLLDEYLGGEVLLGKYIEGNFARYNIHNHSIRSTIRDTLSTLGIEVGDIHAQNVKGGKIIDYGRFYLYDN